MIVETVVDDYVTLIAGRAPRTFILADTAIAPTEVLEMLATVAATVRANFSPASWLIIEADEIVGMCSITRPPIGGVIDIGYGIAPSRQNRGIARRAVGEIVRWATANPHVTALTAETSRANLASQSVLQRNGFLKVGARVDSEDGPLICWRVLTDQA